MHHIGALFLLFIAMGIMTIWGILAGHISNDAFLLAGLVFIGILLLWVTLLEKL